MINSGIYKIENTINGKVYIGSSINIPKRRRDHMTHLRRSEHDNFKLQNAWNKYGEQAFDFSTLLICERESLTHYEQIVIDGFDAVNSGYNICPVAGNCSGVSPSAETRHKLSVALLGKPKKPLSPETKRKLSKINTGKTLSEETRKKISRSNMGRVPSTETRKRLSVSAKNRHPDVVYKQIMRLREKNIGKKLSEEHKRKISEGGRLQRVAKALKQMEEPVDG